MKPFQLKLVSTAFLLALLNAGCRNPTAGIEKDMELFKKVHADKIQLYDGADRRMGYAWNGEVSQRPLILVHGSPGSWQGWAQFLRNESLQQRFHIIAVDRPGFGNSQAGQAELSIKKQADNVIEVLKINQSHLPAILVGHSFGGPVIAKIAMDHPDKVAGLIFVAGAVDPELEKTKWFQYPATWWPLRVLLPTHLRVCNEEIMGLKKELEQMLPEWQKIKAKVYLIQGMKDDLVPSGNQDFLQKNLDPQRIVKSVMEPDLNHFVPWKRPDLIVEGIQALEAAL